MYIDIVRKQPATNPIRKATVASTGGGVEEIIVHEHSVNFDWPCGGHSRTWDTKDFVAYVDLMIEIRDQLLANDQ